jgi:probable phosphoglycerate mutase
VLLVAHNTLFRLLLCNLLGVPLSRYRALFPSLRNGAVTELELVPGNVALLSFNVPL